MDPGARADRGPDRGADPRRHRGQLALRSAARRRLWGRAPLLGLAATLAAAAHSYTWELPRGFPAPAVPADNPMSQEKVDLGRRLFFEPRLSVTGRYSCASCHEPARAYADGRRVAVGATGEPLTSNAPALVNVAYNISFGWDRPKLRSLEAQMRQPMLSTHPVELGLRGREARVCLELAQDPQYARAFAAAFPEDPAVSLGHLIKAIATFERTLIFGNSPFDRYVFQGDHGALSPAAKRGLALFFSARGGCAGCHGGLNFAGNWRDAGGATGPASFARNGTTATPLRVPTLRNVALTAPYMHDGRYATLAQVLEHYSQLPQRGALPDRRLPHAAFSAEEKLELLAFLDSLSDPSVSASSGAAGR